MSKIHTVVEQLRSSHTQSLWVVLYYSLAPLFHYWVQHIYPSASTAAAATVDDALLAAAEVCFTHGAFDDRLIRRRLRLPARLFGGGLRSCSELAPAAFIGTLCRTLPQMLPRVTSHGGRQSGFLPALSALLGDGSFDEGFEDIRFHPLASSDCALGRAFKEAWAELQTAAGYPDTGLLATTEFAAGHGSDHVQRDLTKQVEQHRFRALDTDLRALAADDYRRATWLNLDQFSTAWVPAWPNSDCFLNNAEFAEVGCRYFALPSPACQPRQGERIGATRDRLDIYGARLAAAKLPGDGWRTQHDALKWRLLEDAWEMGIRGREEVFGLFQAYLPQPVQDIAAAWPGRQRQGMVPDLILAVSDGHGAPVQDRLYEIKTLHYAPSTYPRGAETRAQAVAQRALAVPGEYATKARQLDTRFCDTPIGAVGPISARLRSFGEIRALVFGSWGEASPAASTLLSACAAAGATRHWRGMLAKSEGEAVGALAWLLRRRWGVAAVREAARLTLDRLEYVGPGAPAAASRRSAAREAAAARRQDAFFQAHGLKAAASVSRHGH